MLFGTTVWDLIGSMELAYICVYVCTYESSYSRIGQKAGCGYTPDSEIPAVEVQLVSQLAAILRGIVG